ncbi:MAG: GTPase Era [Alphaproteobacteria bacterium]|nr:GTPase Era [Alphaproteobacteria bacterium]
MNKSENTPTRAGFAAIIGAPNSGKSTLLNHIIGHKLSIVSSKAQTTRMRVLGLLTEGETQIGLIDTPGIFSGATGSSDKLDKAMLQAAWQSLEGADAIVLITDATTSQAGGKTDLIIETLSKQKRRVILAINKVDKIKREKLLPMAERFNETKVFDEIFMISALNGTGVPELKSKLISLMPPGPWLFPKDQLSDLPERLLAAEATREQLFCQTYDELPYSVAVLPESWEVKKDKSIVIRQTILVARPNHRAIVLGKNGAKIKAIGHAARQQMAVLFGCTVHLFLQVKVDDAWQEKNEFYRLFGLSN